MVFAEITLLFFGCYLLFHPASLIGADTPAYMLHSCTGSSAFTSGMPLGYFFFNNLPCNEVFFKAVCIMLLFLSCVILAKLGELYYPNNGWLLGLLAFANLCWNTEFFKLEEMNLAYPILFAAIYYACKAIKTGKKAGWFASLLLICLAGFFWKGSIFLLPIPALYCAWIAILEIPIFAIYGLTMIEVLTRGLKTFLNNTKGINEEAFLWGVAFHSILLTGIIGIWKKERELRLLLIYTIFLGILAQKYILFSVPVLGLGVLALINSQSEVKQKLWKWEFSDREFFERLYLLFAISTMILVLFTQVSIAFPIHNEVQAIQYTVQESHGESILNDWGYGWWIQYYGGKTNYYSGEIRVDFNNSKGIGLTSQDTNCKVLKRWKNNLKTIKCG
jgi:hypothetical protein